MGATLRAGLVQARTGIAPAANAAWMHRALERLAADGAEITFTPEMSGLLDRDRQRLLANAPAEADEPTLAAAREVSAQTGMWIAIGSLAVRTSAPAPAGEVAAPAAGGGDEEAAGVGAPLLANRSFLIDGTGAIAARYDKIHRFDVDLGPGQRYRESATFAAGSQAVVADTPWGRLGLSVCYDLRFNALYDAYAEAGATLIAIPAAFTRPTGEAHWHTLQRARAILGQCFVLAAAQCGRHEDGRETYGHGLAIGPWGEVLLDMGDSGPGTAIVELPLGAVAETRAKLPALAHRRPFNPSA
ncbi:MAG: carbon-nitrogen hydrolase family protein [Sphingomonadaceae bacterium]|nr:carbon-nitrogen hydrolase family protein [Sphingomonadaceae bacterium]